MVLLLICVLLFSLVIQVSGSTFNSALIVLENSIKYSSLRANLEIIYPVLYDTNDDQAIKIINTTIQRDIDNFYNYFLNITEPSSMFYCEGNASYEVTLNSNDLLSINITYYEYTGGAHGMYTMINYTFDTKTGKLLALQDLFIPEFDFITPIKDKVLTEVNKEREIYFAEAPELITQTDFSFYLLPKTIVVYYDLYDIAPYSSGIRTFEIPRNIFHDNIKLNF